MNKIFNLSLIKELKTICFLSYLLLFVSFIYIPTAYTYELLGYKWPQPYSTFYVDITGSDGQWNDAFEGAMYEWSAATVFQFYIVKGEYSDPCNSFDDRNGVRFNSTDCGDSWGSTTLAITHTWYRGSTITETDIVFNLNESWNVYWTAWSSYPWNGVSDFRRVAVHELGHAIGLDHEDSGISTIMNTYVDNTTVPQQDDINGVAAIYGDIQCTYSLSPAGRSVFSGGISSSLYVSTSSNCSWTASENLSWVTITSGSSGTGSGSVYYTVAPNTTSSQRSGTLTVAGNSFTITQFAAPCTYAVSPASASFNSSSGSVSVFVDASSPSCAWTASESLTWVYLSRTSGAGDGSVTVGVSANTGALRSGTIAIAGKSFSIIQSAAPLNTYYRDFDDDGYGNPDDVMSAYSQPSGYVTDHTDCNDNDASIYPGAAESCNYLDDDCDDVVDEGCEDIYNNPPDKVTLISPSGTIEDTTPTFTWDEVISSTWYKIYISNTAKTYKFIQWYELEDNSSSYPEASCTGGKCSITFDTALETGIYDWWVIGWNDNGSGDWSDRNSFTIIDNTSLPLKIILVSPSGITEDTTPTFTWKKDANATWYRLYLYNKITGYKFVQWYEIEDNNQNYPEADCTGSECSITINSDLEIGDYQWWVIGWNENGNGVWSDPMDTTITENSSDNGIGQ